MGEGQGWSQTLILSKTLTLTLIIRTLTLTLALTLILTLTLTFGPKGCSLPWFISQGEGVISQWGGRRAEPVAHDVHPAR